MLVWCHQLQTFRTTQFFLMQVGELHMDEVCVSISTVIANCYHIFFFFHVFHQLAGQRVLKFHRESQCVSCFQFSNLGVLGLPYWLVCPIERVCNGWDGPIQFPIYFLCDIKFYFTLLRVDRELYDVLAFQKRFRVILFSNSGPLTSFMMFQWIFRQVMEWASSLLQCASWYYWHPCPFTISNL